jgi:uncharacterized protein YdcH (DUF465 family)
MKLYSEYSSENLFSGQRKSIEAHIENESEDYILNVGENQYADFLISKYILDFPIIEKENAYVDSYDTEILGSQFPAYFPIYDKNKYYKKVVIVYYIPFTGNINLLKFRPRTYNTAIGYNLHTENQNIKIEIINFNNDSEEIKNTYNNHLNRIFACYGNLKSEIEDFNSNLESFIKSTLNNRKQKTLAKKDFISSLGVPIKEKKDTARTFSVPKPNLREKISIKPKVLKKGYSPEPTMDSDSYLKILKLINDVGKNFERLPSLYADKQEEDLRDHILMTLDPNFEYGSASGETFNKSGKTDIQLRYDSSVVFISECKFWAGEKKFLDSIDQLLSYLTWRDSKTSIVLFVRTKEIVPIIEKVKNSLKQHANFISELEKSDENWFNSIFSLPVDTNKEIKLAVQLFHLP